MMKNSRTPIPKFSRKTAGYWQSGSLIECCEIHDELTDVRSYHFKDPAGGGFKFKAGQHISILLTLDLGDEYRTFTIASSPTRVDTLTLTVKTNRPDGATAWMRDHIKIGTQIIASGPAGQFNIADNPCEKILLISAGSGITPMMSMVRWLTDRGDDIEITFIHYAKNSDQYLFSDELKAMKHPSLKIHQISTERADSEINGFPTSEQISPLVDFKDVRVFCCGPSGFMEKIKSITQTCIRYHQESFGTENIDLQKEQIDENAENLTINWYGRMIAAKKGANLLNILRQNKIIIPTGCQSGMCGTCQLKIKDGIVDMDHQGGLSDAQEKDGMILACCSTLKTDLIID